jgi:transcriptional regulator with AAA-type ATPase domain
MINRRPVLLAAGLFGAKEGAYPEREEQRQPGTIGGSGMGQLHLDRTGTGIPGLDED